MRLQGCRRSCKDKLKCLKIISIKGHNSAKICPNINYLPKCTSILVEQQLYQVSFKSVQGCRRSLMGWKDGQSKHLMLLAFLWRGHKNSKCQAPAKFVQYELSPKRKSRLEVQYYCQISFNRCKYVGEIEKTTLNI